MSRIEVVPDGDGSTHVIVSAELDLVTSSELQERLGEVDGGRGRIVMVDLSECLYVDSTGLKALLNASRRLTRSRGALAVICPNRPSLRVFEITQTVDTLNVAETEGQATALAQRWRERLQLREDEQTRAAN